MLSLHTTLSRRWFTQRRLILATALSLFKKHSCAALAGLERARVTYLARLAGFGVEVETQ